LAVYRTEPEVLKEQLKEVIEAEEQGMLTAALRMRKKTLQQAYEQAIKHKMVCTCVLFCTACALRKSTHFFSFVQECEASAARATLASANAVPPLSIPLPQSEPRCSPAMHCWESDNNTFFIYSVATTGAGFP
jgi:hypothetical protein